jgi:hypothetical protein
LRKGSHEVVIFYIILLKKKTKPEVLQKEIGMGTVDKDEVRK